MPRCRHDLTPLALALALFFAGCGAAANGAVAPRPGPSSANSVELVAVAYRNGPNGPEGTTSPVTVSVAPNATGRPRVAIFEGVSGGAGEQWRAATWVGAVHASKLTGRPLRDFEVTVGVEGLIDGPSAGALMTAGIIAAMQHVPVRRDVTMTGTINPDGTIGPVGGIAYKMQAAASAGFRVFGYPRGSRFDTDLANGRAIDLQELADQLGITAVEIADIEDAFFHLTGVTPPRNEAVRPSEIVISRALDRRMRSQIAQWGLLVAQGAEAWQRQPRIYRDLLRPNMEEARRLITQADQHLRQGLVATAYKNARDAAVMIHDIDGAARVFDAGLRSDGEALLAEAAAAATVEREHQAYLAELAAQPVNTVGDALYLLDAYDAAHRARSAIILARAELERGVALLEDPGEGPEAEERFDEVVAAFAKATFQYGAARFVLDAGRDSAALSSKAAEGIPLDVARLRDLAESTTIAAKAVLDYYDTIAVQGIADAQHIDESSVRRYLVMTDIDYREASVRIGYAFEHLDPASVHEALSTLAAADGALVDASLLVMRDYSLQVRMERGEAVEVANDLALMTALELADERARQSAGLAVRHLGVLPDEAAVVYERSRIAGQGSLQERLYGLRGFWCAAVVSRTATYLAAR